MENTIKQSESERERGFDLIRRLHGDYKPLKDAIDRLRMSLGLERLAPMEEEGSVIEYVQSLFAFYFMKYLK